MRCAGTLHLDRLLDGLRVIVGDVDVTSTGSFFAFFAEIVDRARVGTA
jgi:hypothetical protein